MEKNPKASRNSTSNKEQVRNVKSMRRNHYDQEGIRIIITYGRKNFSEKQWFDKDSFRFMTYVTENELPSISIALASIAIILDATHFSLLHAPIQSIFKLMHDRYVRDIFFQHSSCIYGARYCTMVCSNLKMLILPYPCHLYISLPTS